MKDKTARDDIRGLERRIFGSDDAVFLGGMARYVKALEGRIEYLEGLTSHDICLKPCPECKHETLMRRTEPEISGTAWGIYPGGEVEKFSGDKYTCLVCGKTFREADGLAAI